MGNDMDLNTLFALAEKMANKEADGHLTIMKFTTEWKVKLGTPDLDTGDGRKEISDIPGFPTIQDALGNLFVPEAK